MERDLLGLSDATISVTVSKRSLSGVATETWEGKSRDMTVYGNHPATYDRIWVVPCPYMVFSSHLEEQGIPDRNGNGVTLSTDFICVLCACKHVEKEGK